MNHLHPKAQNKMHYFQKTNCNAESAADRDLCCESARSINQKSRNFSKGSIVSALNSRNRKQRYVLTFLELDASCKILVPVLSPVEVSTQKGHAGSGNEMDVQSLEPLYPSVVILPLFDLNKGPKSGLHERSNNNLKYSAARKSLEDNVDNEVNPTTHSDFFDSINTIGASNPSKRSSRSSRKKSKKKKQKQYKICKKEKSSFGPETQCDEISCASEASSPDLGACPSKQVSQSSSPEKVEVPSITGKDNVVAKYDIEDTSDDYQNSSATPTTRGSCSYSDLLDDSEYLSPRGFHFRSIEGCNNLSDTSLSTQSLEGSLATADDDAFDCSSTSQSGNKTVSEGHNGSNISAGFMAMNSSDSDSFRNSSMESLSDPSWLNSTADSDNSFERAQCSSQFSDNIYDFRPVMYRRKSRLNKKIIGNIEGGYKYDRFPVRCHWKDNGFSTRQKVLKGPSVCMPVRMESAFNFGQNNMPPVSCKLARNSNKFIELKAKDEVSSQLLCSKKLPHVNDENFQSRATIGDHSTECLPRTVDGILEKNVLDKFGNESIVGYDKVDRGKSYGCEVSQETMSNFDRDISVIGETGSPCCSGSGIIKSANEDGFDRLKAHQTSRGDCDSVPRTCAEDPPCCSHQSLMSHASSDGIEALSYSSYSSHDTPLGSSSDYDEKGGLAFENGNSHKNYCKISNNCAHADLRYPSITVENNLFLKLPLDMQVPVNEQADVLIRANDDVQTCRLDCETPCSSGRVTGTTSCSIFNGFDCVAPDIKFGSTQEVCFICDHSHGLSMYQMDQKNTSMMATALEKMLQAAYVSYKMRSVAKRVHFTSHNHAKIEEFIHCTSPVLDQMPCGNHLSCLQCRAIYGSLSCHRFLRLVNLWQWYEKPGIYGLEVKMDPYAYFKGAKNDDCKLHSYFVPYLSSIQLFGCAKSSIFTSGHCREGHNLCSPIKTLKKFNLTGFPIMPLPISSLSVANEASFRLIGGDTCDGNLLFEYFESDQPQHRKPFFEKIKDILCAKTTSNDQIYGDPLNLGCMSLCDVHPASWYSVAWYPIYQIPEGNFRASFLTYHSLGLFATKEAPTPSSIPKQIVSPVVGLQSYNAEAESWFKIPEFISSLDGKSGLGPGPSAVLKERLQALEQAASAMSRASVYKGETLSMNRHPDYEFFTSRRR